jgi:hypothetical protein
MLVEGLFGGASLLLAEIKDEGDRFSQMKRHHACIFKVLEGEED